MPDMLCIVVGDGLLIFCMFWVSLYGNREPGTYVPGVPFQAEIHNILNPVDQRV